MSSFSQRHGYVRTSSHGLIREEAPHSIRVIALNAAQSCYLSVAEIEEVVCRALRERMSPESSSVPEKWQVVERLMDRCPWFKVYDAIEALSRKVSDWNKTKFAQEINDCCTGEGIGWQLVNGEIVTRGDEGFQEAVKTATSQLKENQRPTAAGHIQSAVKALSERPKANTPGAVAHATSAVECVLHDVTGETMTLGRYLDKHPRLFHPSLKKALDGVYGYASDAGARHGKEGQEPTFAEAQFAITACAGACTLLNATNPRTEDGR